MSQTPISPAAAPDPRRNAYRPDLASRDLEGKVAAARFVSGVAATVMHSAIPLRREPDPRLGLETEALYGETLDILEEANGWAWVQLHADRYVGYVPAAALCRQQPAPTHRVSALATFLYPAPDIKTPPLMLLPLNALVHGREIDDSFLALEGGGFIHRRHLVARDRTARDFAEVAERFLGTPYLWGGRTRIGIDCSGLVQIALQAAGIAAPRDSDMQRCELGSAIDITPDFANLQRGDLVFWQGHVAIMLNGVMMVHANAHHMQVAVEPLPEAAARIAKTGTPLLAIRRLPSLTA